MFIVISVMSETNVCETPINMNAHPAYHPLADPKTLVQMACITQKKSYMVMCYSKGQMSGK